MSFQVTNIFVNLPVKDLPATMAFFEKVGFTYNMQFTADHAACMIIGSNMYAMLLTEEYFKTFTKKDIADATKTTEVLVALSVESREQVDTFVDNAIAAGGTLYAEAIDHGFMYTRSFADLDGHQWEVVWMDPSAVQ